MCGYRLSAVRSRPGPSGATHLGRLLPVDTIQRADRVCDSKGSMADPAGATRPLSLRCVPAYQVALTAIGPDKLATTTLNVSSRGRGCTGHRARAERWIRAGFSG
jgi:hypothetical protein